MASFMLGQIFYEGRGSKDQEDYYAAPNMPLAFIHFKRLASTHPSSSLEAAYDAFAAGNTSLALMLYLLHAEVCSILQLLKLLNSE